MTSRSSLLLPLIAAGIVTTSVAGAAVWAKAHWLPGDGLAPGLRIGGAPVPPGTDLPAWVAERARELTSRPVELSIAGVAGSTRKASLAELGVRVDVDRIVRTARAVGREGPLADRVLESSRARRGEIDLPMYVGVEAPALLSVLEPVKDETDEPAIPARLDLDKHTVVPSRPGHYLDLDAAIEALSAAALAGTDKIALERRETEPRVSSGFLEKLDIHEVLSKFETRFGRGGDQANRARNIERAAGRMDGVVLMPHEIVSFNAAVGPRTVENGFSKGWEIFKGEMVEGIGGGTCQAASTFHAAAFLSGLDVVERLPHSRPSAYITMGLDATVVYPVVDLKVRNPFDFPIVVHSRVDANTVTFELLGAERPAKVTFGRDVVGSRPYARKVEETPGMVAGKIVRKQHGIRGYTVKRTRVVAMRDGSERVDSNVDVYPPTTEIYLVPPGTDPDAVLPPLPEDPSRPKDETTASEAVAQSPSAEGADSNKPAIVEAPGVHKPTAEQANAPARIVIGPGGR